MAEFWEPIVTRLQQTIGVWNLQPTFKVGTLTKEAHAANGAVIVTAKKARDDQQDIVDAKLAARDGNTRLIRNANLRVALLLDATMDEEIEKEADLANQLDDVFAIEPDSEHANQNRAIKFLSVWKMVDDYRAALTLPLPPILLGTLDRAGLQALLDAKPALQQELEDERAILSTKRSALRRAVRNADRGNKRWFRAWSAIYKEGTDEYAALAQIDTGEAQQEPDALEIAALTPQSGGMVLVSYLPDGGEGATEERLLYQLVGTDADFAHPTPVNLAGQLLGPFLAGAVLNVQTIASRIAGSTTSEVKSLTLS